MGPDFKQTNNNLAFGGIAVLKTAANVVQLSEKVQAAHRDSLGTWVFVLSGNESPGNFNSKNTDAVFGSAEHGAQARYVYGTFSPQRPTELPWGFNPRPRPRASWPAPISWAASFSRSGATRPFAATTRTSSPATRAF